ncbi:MAG TPA: competence/damage-inducible protein A, partial [Elusimicrobia bacterium]|nr:competence/damage-inducible protein A [Elusimicrobiota bacterium]
CRKLLGKTVYGAGEDTLASAAGEKLKAAGGTLACAESCTGGLAA